MFGPVERAFSRARRNLASASTHATSIAVLQPVTATSSLYGTVTPTQTSTNRRRRAQVSTLSDRYAATRWIVSHARDRGK